MIHPFEHGKVSSGELGKQVGGAIAKNRVEQTRRAVDPNKLVSYCIRGMVVSLKMQF
jgi:hypothetical protein